MIGAKQKIPVCHGRNEDKILQFLRVYRGHHLSHLIFQNDKQIYWTRNNRVLIVYKKVANKLIVLGDPIGPVDHIGEAIQEFEEYANNHGLKANYYQIDSRLIPMYKNAGYSFFKLGEEARVDLTQFSLAGKEGAKLRTRKNKFEKKGYIMEMQSPPHSPSLLSELRHISDAWLGIRKEKGFSVVFFDEEYVSKFPAAIFRDADGRAIAFATLASDQHEQGATVCIDLMRYLPECPHGTMDVLFISIFLQAKEQGYDWCSLGMAPLANVGVTSCASKSEKVARLAYLYGDSFYKFKGLKDYKGKFAHKWEPKYLAYKRALLPLFLMQMALAIHRREN